MSSPFSSPSSSSTSSAGALLAKSLSIINCRNPSSADSFVPPPNAISLIRYTAYPLSVFFPDKRTLIWFSPSHFKRLTNRASTSRISALIVPPSSSNSKAVCLLWFVKIPQEWWFHSFLLLSRTRIGFSMDAWSSLDENVVYVHTTGFLSSGALLKSNTGIFCTPFSLSFFLL